MRELADSARIERFMAALGRAAEGEGDCYLTGGASAVLLGWRPSTIDVDIRLEPESESLLRAIQALKEELRINVELASPLDFIPVPSGWEERSVFVKREGKLSFRHFDFYGQVLAKLERSHTQDLADVDAMLERRLVDPDRALAYLEEIEPELYRYPAIDPPTFAQRVRDRLGRHGS